MAEPLSPDLTALQQQLGATVRSYRHQLGITQHGLAARTRLRRTYIADVERGRRNVSLSSLGRIAGGLGVALSAFFRELERAETDAGRAPALAWPPPAQRARGAVAGGAQSRVTQK